MIGSIPESEWIDFNKLKLTFLRKAHKLLEYFHDLFSIYENTYMEQQLADKWGQLALTSLNGGSEPN